MAAATQAVALSGTKWEAVPRVGPEHLARWEDWLGNWRLVIVDRHWDVLDSVTTDALVKYPHPGDAFLARLGYVPVPGSEWEADGVAWQREVCPVHQRTRRG